MSFKTSLVKIAIKLTPNFLILWVGNIILKGIAELTDLIFDLDTRTAYVQFTLFGEVEPIEVWLDGFAIVNDGDSHQLIIQHTRSNRPWLDNLLSRIAGKPWKIPEIAQYKAEIDLVSELFEAETPEDH